MNPDISNLPPEEFEPKVTALLLGELDAVEAAGLREVLSRDPALRQLHDELARTLGFVHEAVAQPAEPAPSAVLPRMDAARREALLARLRSPRSGSAAEGFTSADGGPSGEDPGAVIPVEFPTAADVPPPAAGLAGASAWVGRGSSSRWEGSWLPLAACLAALLAAASLLLPSLTRAKSKSLAISRLNLEREQVLQERMGRVETWEMRTAEPNQSGAGPAGDWVSTRAPVEDAPGPLNFRAPVSLGRPVGGVELQDHVSKLDDRMDDTSTLRREVELNKADAGPSVASLPASPAPLPGLVQAAPVDPGARGQPAMRPELARRYGLAASAPMAAPAANQPAGPVLDFAKETPVRREARSSRGVAFAVEDLSRQPRRLNEFGGGLGGGGGGRNVAANPGPAPGVGGPGEGDFGAMAQASAPAEPSAWGRPLDTAADKFSLVTVEGTLVGAGNLPGAMVPPPPAEVRGRQRADRGTTRAAGRVEEVGETKAWFDAAGVEAPSDAPSDVPSRGADSRFRYLVSVPAKPDAPVSLQKTEASGGVLLNELAAKDGPGAPAAAQPMGSSLASVSNGRSQGGVRGGVQSGAKVPVLGQEPRLGLFFKQNHDPAGDAVEGEESRKKRLADRPVALGVLADAGVVAEAKSTAEAEVVGLHRLFGQNAMEAIRPLRRAGSDLVPQPEVSTSENAFSTFSLNVTDVSFKLAGAALDNGTLPDPGSIRSEEFVNAFQYRDPEPASGRPLAFAWDRAQYPFAQQRDLLRLSVRTAARGREAGRPLNLVLAVDNSGSMERIDRVQTLRESMRALAGQLRPEDRVSLVSFARTARLWLDGIPGDRANELVETAGSLTPEGGTNLEDALRVGYEAALKNFQAQGVNRVVLLTDGAANLGDVEPETLRRMVESYRQRGVALDAFGIGWEGFNDDLLESLTRNGDGRYGFVNSPEEAAGEFAAQLAGALQVAANDVKVQVEFNPRRVASWRQIGYAKHQLTQEQFRDNTVDAAELGAAEAGNALYVIEPLPRGEGPIAQVRARFRSPSTGLYEEHEWAVPYAGPAASIDRATPAQKLANTAAAFSEWLASSPFAGEVTPARLLEQISGVPAAFQPDPRPARLEAMIRQAQSLSGR